MDLDGTIVTIIDDDDLPKLSKSKVALIKKRPIQSVSDLPLEFRFVRETPREGRQYDFVGIVSYPLIAQIDPGDENFYNDTYRCAGDHADPRKPHVFHCGVYLREAFMPAMSDKSFEYLKVDAVTVTENELRAQHKKHIEVFASRGKVKIITFEEPLHMAMMIADIFNYRIGTAEVKVNGQYQAGSRRH